MIARGRIPRDTTKGKLATEIMCSFPTTQALKACSAVAKMKFAMASER